MTSREERAKNLKVAYIGGGSRGWAWGFMSDLAQDPDMQAFRFKTGRALFERMAC